MEKRIVSGLRAADIRAAVAAVLEREDLPQIVQLGHPVLRQAAVPYDGQIEDAGPGKYDDATYVFGKGDHRPANTEFNGAGMDVSPALNGCLGFSSLNGAQDKVDWQFVDEEDVQTVPTHGRGRGSRGHNLRTVLKLELSLVEGRDAVLEPVRKPLVSELDTREDLPGGLTLVRQDDDGLV